MTVRLRQAPFIRDTAFKFRVMQDKLLLSHIKGWKLTVFK